MKYNTHTSPSFSAALDAFGTGWKHGLTHTVVETEDLPSFAYALEAFGTGLPKPKVRQLRIHNECEDFSAACNLVGFCTTC